MKKIMSSAASVILCGLVLCGTSLAEDRDKKDEKEEKQAVAAVVTPVAPVPPVSKIYRKPASDLKATKVMPAGWDQGKKEGWKGAKMPPGLARKQTGVATEVKDAKPNAERKIEKEKKEKKEEKDKKEKKDKKDKKK